ncbi:ankyrin repeat domain-containing protein [Bradyrhizobium sp. U87765 SZCCT0131]|nr:MULTISPECIES: ankyrin repeat domain-containing protein [unclassified Bradyrhizobium]MBR1221637.1 ankyrin repeat domain-containing protein [Bradyrhizobium sp. U87765 SZCCT0131]MBR1264440.1 ankyrin repeat domain-containing protein [Bradyrhizobium sp. U87765 SZCCT0134]MBR1304653.1 ankyrin repeat domain-containing protein [Bradyrhizobium sp. U87765 SZCCT0110]MBR1322490.1 ankyrin repeat domain-containing protein [Bradyrhizobium sp. U87765 SZCCT0109]MBR1346582.1 ankyrin repeat domain-containing p
MSEGGLSGVPMDELMQRLFDACRNGREADIPGLLHAGVDVDARDGRGFSPLIIASYNGHEAVTALLLAEGADPNGIHARTGNTALMGVAFKGYEAIARRLIAAGTNVNARTGTGQTALMMAISYGQNGIAELLLAAGADAGIKDSTGNTALSVARARGNAVMADRLSGEGSLP